MVATVEFQRGKEIISQDSINNMNMEQYLKLGMQYL